MFFFLQDAARSQGIVSRAVKAKAVHVRRWQYLVLCQSVCESVGNLVLLGVAVHKMQQLQLVEPRAVARRHYVGGLTRTSISVRQHGARAALERHLTSRLKFQCAVFVGRLTHRTYRPFLQTTGRITSSQVVKVEFIASVWDLWFSQRHYQGMWHRVVWRRVESSCLKMQFGASNTLRQQWCCNSSWTTFSWYNTVTPCVRPYHFCCVTVTVTTTAVP